MSENTVRELFLNLERTIHDRLSVIEDVIKRSAPVPYSSGPVSYSFGPKSCAPGPTGCEPWSQKILERVSQLESEVNKLRFDLAMVSTPLIPPYPLDGIHILPKKEVIITENGLEPLSVADRLLLNKTALNALEKEDEEEETDKWDNEWTEDSSIKGFENPGLEEEEEGEEEEELEEFEYKSSTYYRDSNNNVFMADENGELISNPIGVWSEVKKRIIIQPAA